MYSSKLGRELIFAVWQSDFKPPNFIMYIHNVYDNTFIHSDISLPTFLFHMVFDGKAPIFIFGIA